jgi:hypothetical protein
MATVTLYAAILAMAGCLTLAAVRPTYAQRHCRTIKALTFAPNDEVVARQVQDFRDGDGNKLSPTNSEWIV